MLRQLSDVNLSDCHYEDIELLIRDPCRVEPGIDKKTGMLDEKDNYPEAVLERKMLLLIVVLDC